MSRIAPIRSPSPPDQGRETTSEPTAKAPADFAAALAQAEAQSTPAPADQATSPMDEDRLAPANDVEPPGPTDMFVALPVPAMPPAIPSVPSPDAGSLPAIAEGAAAPVKGEALLSAPAPDTAAPTAPAPPGIAAPAPAASGPSPAPAMPIALDIAPAAPSADPAQTVPIRVASPQALPATIAAEVSGGAKTFFIRLDPAELGEVQVRLQIGEDGIARAHLIVERPSTLHQLMQDAPRLEQALAAAGAPPGPADSGVSFSLKQESRDRSTSGHAASGSHGDQDSSHGGGDPSRAALALYRGLPSHASRLDVTL